MSFFCITKHDLSAFSWHLLQVFFFTKAWVHIVRARRDGGTNSFSSTLNKTTSSCLSMATIWASAPSIFGSIWEWGLRGSASTSEIVQVPRIYQPYVFWPTQMASELWGCNAISTRGEEKLLLQLTEGKIPGQHQIHTFATFSSNKFCLHFMTVCWGHTCMKRSRRDVYILWYNFNFIYLNISSCY